MRHWLITGAAALALVVTAVPQAHAHFVDEDGDGINDNRAMAHRFGNVADRLARVGIDLTEEQAEAVQAQIEALKADGASREDIHAAVTAALGGYGIEMPSKAEMVSSKFSELLTEDQLGTLQSAIEGLGEDATREDVRAAVDATLEELGVEKPRMGRRGRAGAKGPMGQRRGFGRRGPAPEAAPSGDTN